MTLRFERFRYFPESGKYITLGLIAILGFLFTFEDLHNIKETKYFWVTIWTNLLFDTVTILILLKEWDENVDWLRKAPYSVYHNIFSLGFSSLMFAAGIMFLYIENHTGEEVLYVFAFFCFLIFGVRMACFIKAFPKMQQDARFPERPSNSDYDNEVKSMPLNITRFKKIPELVKLLSLLTSLTLLIYLGTIKFRPPGMSVIWFTIGCSIVFDICTIAVLLKEYDVSIMAIRMLPYAAIECVGSILGLIFYVISTAISISSEEVTDEFGFMVVSIFCFISSLIHVSNLIVNIRRWNNGSHHLNPAGVYEYSNYGSES